MGRTTDRRRIGVAAMVLESTEDHRRAGVARYAFELIDAFCSNPRDHEFHLFLLPSFDVPDRWRAQRQFKVHRCWRRYNRWNLIAAGPTAQRLGLDFYLSTAHSVPLLTSVPRGLMVHDLFPLTHPEWFPEGHAKFYRTVLPASCRRSALVFANSYATASEVERQLAIPQERIVVTHLGPGEPIQRPSKRPGKVRLIELGIPFETYLLFVGTLEPRKNLDRLLRGFAQVGSAELNGAGLVIAGGKGWKCDEIMGLVDALGLQERVKFLGFVPDDDLPDLFAGCELFVYPSLDEGFGLPILEAMQAGAPVVCSDTGAMPEVAGDAARYFDPCHETKIGEALASALRSHREEWVSKGLRRASGFSWESTASLTLDAIEAHLGSGT